MSLQRRTRELFGGAIVADAPTYLIDASDLRQVPDTQEVLLYPDSEVSIVVEILQSVKPTDSDDIAKFHFDSLAHDNSAVDFSIIQTSVLVDDHGDNTPSPIVLEGNQKVPKFNHVAPDEVRILLAVFRVKEKNADLVVTFNVPIKKPGMPPVPETIVSAARLDFDVFVRTLCIKDFDLFA